MATDPTPNCKKSSILVKLTDFRSKSLTFTTYLKVRGKQWLHRYYQAWSRSIFRQTLRAAVTDGQNTNAYNIIHIISMHQGYSSFNYNKLNKQWQQIQLQIAKKYLKILQFIHSSYNSIQYWIHLTWLCVF